MSARSSMKMRAVAKSLVVLVLAVLSIVACSAGGDDGSTATSNEGRPVARSSAALTQQECNDAYTSAGFPAVYTDPAYCPAGVCQSSYADFCAPAGREGVGVRLCNQSTPCSGSPANPMGGTPAPCPCPLDGGTGADVEAGPKCKTCADYGTTACGRFPDGCGAMLTCSTCPAGELCNLATSTCGVCSDPPNTPPSSSTPPFKGWKFELPGGQKLCKGIKKIPYLGTAIVAGFDKPTIKVTTTGGQSSSSTGLQKCVETTKTSDTESWAVDICAVTVAYTANGTGEGTSSFCADCIDGQGHCGALSCQTNKATSGGRGSASRKIKEVTGLGDLILCPPDDTTCGEFAARLNKRFGIEIEGAATASVGSKRSTKVSLPGACSPCEDCTESTRSIDPSLVGTVKGTFKVTLLDAGRFGKVGGGLSLGAFIGLGGSVSNTVKSGACGNSNCDELSGNVQGGVFIEFMIQGFRFERNWSWVGRCQASLGGKYCEPGGLAPTFDFKCSANDASVFDSGAD